MSRSSRHTDARWLATLTGDGPLARVSAALRKQLGADGLALLVRDGDVLLQAASDGPLSARSRIGTRFARAHGDLSWRVVDEGTACAIEDARNFRFTPVAHPQVGAAMVAPLLDEGEAVGALLAVWREPRAFSTETLEAVELLAGHATVAVELERALARERAERALADGVVAALGEVLLVCSTDGTISRASPTADELFGYPHEQLVGMSVDDLVPGVTRAIRTGQRAPLRRKGGARPMATRGADIRALRANGTEVPIEVWLSRTEGDDHAASQVIVIVSDISERMATQASVERHQRLEAVGQFAGGLAHDVNNSLMVMIGFTQMAYEITSSVEQRALLERVLDAGSHAGELAKQLLVFAGTDPQPVVRLDVNALVRDLQQMANGLLGDHVEVETLLAAGLPPALGDPTQLQQVLLNLVLNARDAMPGGGTITLRTARATLEQQRAGQRLVGEAVQITVADTGEGMDAETLAHATDPFFTTKGELGTGLGLATANTLVASLNGELELSSTPGQGTEATISLPLDDGRVGPAPARTVAPALPLAPELRVLLVEDAEAVREMALHMLTGMGHRVTAAADAAEALALDATLFDLVVCDIELPGMSGPQMVSILRERMPGLAVVFVSGYASQAARATAEDVPFVLKPFSSADLAQAIARSSLPPKS